MPDSQTAIVARSTLGMSRSATDALAKSDLAMQPGAGDRPCASVSPADCGGRAR